MYPKRTKTTHFPPCAKLDHAWTLMTQPLNLSLQVHCGDRRWVDEKSG